MAVFTSLGFLIFQSLYVMLSAVSFNERLVKNMETDDACSKIIAIVFLLLITVANIAWLVMMFITFGGLSTGNLAMLIVTAVVYLLFLVLPCFEIRHDASIFTSSLVSFYIIWLQWSALSSNPDATVNPYAGSSGNATARLTISLLFCFVAIFTFAAYVQDDTPPVAVEEAAADDQDD